MKTIGVFDSGVGGLSVLRALMAEIPQARFVYVADSAFAPYGSRTALEVRKRAIRLSHHLRIEHAVDALVVACNTATAHAIDALREQHPDLAIVGVEPALKPAATLSRNGHIGVLATRGTVQSERFARLQASVASATHRPVQFTVRACDGLADAIERFDRSAVRQLCAHHLDALRSQSRASVPLDILVLGCTHYPFAADILSELTGPDVALIETSAPVAQRTRALLGLNASAPTAGSSTGLTLLSSGDPASLAQAARRWLGCDQQAQPLPDRVPLAT